MSTTAADEFNNLAKNLAMRLYWVCYVGKQAYPLYQQQLERHYHDQHLAKIIRHISQQIGAQILHLNCQAYYPQGASASALLSEASEVNSPQLLAHLDKSHISLHTYPDRRPHQQGVHSFRLDVEISSCGQISPCYAIPYLLQHLPVDVMTIDYRIRGFNRDAQDRAYYQEQKSINLQTYLASHCALDYHSQHHRWSVIPCEHSRLMRKKTQQHNQLQHEPDTDTAWQALVQQEMQRLYQRSPS